MAAWQPAEISDDPAGITVDAADRPYVCDKTGNSVQILSADGTLLSNFGSYGSGHGQFDFSQGGAVAADPNGYIYVTDTANNRVQHFLRRKTPSCPTAAWCNRWQDVCQGYHSTNGSQHGPTG